MFFPRLIKNIKPNDRVLEVGPGGLPHPKSAVFLEKKFSQKEAEGQRGYAPPLKTHKKVIFYDGKQFPFRDKEFDYVICSHVLEHVEDVEYFLSELQRVARKGYLEFPTIYYDYIYNFPEHTMFLFYRNNTIFYLPKKETLLDGFLPVTRLFYRTLQLGHGSFIKKMRYYFFQGFEWFDQIQVQKAKSLDELTYNIDEIKMAPSWLCQISRIFKR